MTVDPDSLLHELRSGEREGFVRYFELYRAPVYNLAWWLLRDGAAAVSATDAVFTTAYRRILLHDGAIDLRAWTYRAALDVCRERLGEGEAQRGVAGEHDAAGRGAEGRLHRAPPGAVPGSDPRETSDLARRFGQALEMVEFRHQAVLLLHDATGLQLAELAIVFGVTEDAVSALLFRAREEFRRAFEELSADRRTATCRLAEQTAAGAVGRSLSDTEVHRLDQHAGYCRHCRRTMKGWGAGALGLALFLKDAPLPQALEATPVFGTTTPATGASDGVAGSIAVTGVLASIGRSLTSRAAAYALAAACLVLAVGLAAQHSQSDRTVVVIPGTGLSVPLSIPPAAIAVRPSTSRSSQTIVASARRSTRIPVATSARPLSDALIAVGSNAGVTGPAVIAVAGVGRLSDGGRLTVGNSATSSAARAHALAHKGGIGRRAKATRPGHFSAHPGHSGKGNRSHAHLAGTQHGKTAKHLDHSVKQPAAKVKKADAGKGHDHKKNKMNH